ncbi:MAG: LysR family transcriptional regulator [Pseudomonadota bacterium]
MDVEALRLFVDVARRLSFAAVAGDRDINPSSVSRAIGSLEADLGIRLLHRTTRRMTLTEAGDLYFRRVSALLDGLDEARDEARSISARPSGTLRLTASVAFGERVIVPLVPAFRQAYPDLRLELLLTDKNLNLVAEGVDLAIRLGAQPEPGLIGTKLFATRYHVCASPDWVERNAVLQDPTDLESVRCLLFTLPGYRSEWRLRGASGTEIRVPVAGDVLVSSALSLRSAVLQGLGPALIADWLVGDDLATGRLIDLFPDHAATATDFETAAWALYPSRAYLPIKTRVAIDFLRDKVAWS